MSFEHIVRAFKDDMTLVGNLIGLKEHLVGDGETVIFVPSQPSWDFVLVRWTREDDYLTLLPDTDALDGYTELLRAKLAELHHDIDLRPRSRRARSLSEAVPAFERVLSAFEAARKRESP